MSATRDSFEEAAEAFARLETEMEKATDKGLREIGEEIMTDVKASRQGKGVPVDKGTLRSTGTVEGPDPEGVVTLAFGGPAAKYAITQHERTDYSHTVGESRYLVRGVDRWRAGGSAAFRALQAQAVQAVAQSGGLGAATSGFTSAPSAPRLPTGP